MTILKLVIAGVLLAHMGCSSPDKDIRSQVSKGMDKDDVLELLGSPSRSKRVNGADRWTYDQYKGDKKKTTHVYFKKGKVSLVGSDDDLIKEIKELSEQNKSLRKKKPEKFRDL